MLAREIDGPWRASFVSAEAGTSNDVRVVKFLFSGIPKNLDAIHT